MFRWNAIGTTFRQNTSIIKFAELELFIGLTELYMAFQACTNLELIKLPPTITQLRSNSFRQASKLAEITLPATLATVDNYAIYQMDALRSLTCLATTPPTVSSNNGIPSACQIYVPASAVNSYKSATWWSNYASRISPIPE